MRASLAVRRSRTAYAFLIALVIALGLASREYPDALPTVLGKYPGDGLWALMVFLLVCFFKPRWTSGKAALFALILSFVVEFSQLWQAPWLNALRENRLGNLVLGSEFHVADLAAYAVGIAMGLAMELLWQSRRSRQV